MLVSFHKIVLVTTLLLALVSCNQTAFSTPTRTPALDANVAPTFTPYIPDPTRTTVLDDRPAPTFTPYEQVATMVDAPNESTPDRSAEFMRTLPPTSAGTPTGDLLPVTFDTLDLLAIPPTTYTDEIAGFSLDYPAAWQVTPPPAHIPPGGGVYSASIISFARVTPGPKQQEGIPEGHAKIEIVVFEDRTYTYEDAVQSQRDQRAQEEMQSSPLLMDEGWLLPSGLPARRWLVQGFAGRVNILITAIDGRKVIVAGYGEPGLFNVIAGSLRPN